MKVGQTEEAERWYKEALKAKADHVPAHLTMAKLLHKKVLKLGTGVCVSHTRMCYYL